MSFGELAGRERFFKHASINQLSEHRRLYLRATPIPIDKLHSLLIANFNYAHGEDPRKRGQIFDSGGTVEASERLLAEGHGVISTWDLHQILRGIQRGEIVLSAMSLRRLLLVEGIFDVKRWTLEDTGVD